MKRCLVSVSLLLLVFLLPTSFIADDHKTLAIGASAPDFKLQGIDGKTYTLESFKDAKVLAVVFICIATVACSWSPSARMMQ